MLNKIKSIPVFGTVATITLLSILATSTSLLGAPLVAFAAVILATYLLLPDRMMFLSRLLVSYALFYVYTLSFAFVLQIFKTSFSLNSLLISFSIALILTAFLSQPKRSLKKPTVSVAELVIVLACFLGFFAIVRPILNQPLPVVVKALATGEDNASHLALYNSFLEHDKSAYFNDGTDLGIFNNLVGYPQGLHINMAVNTMIMEGETDPKLGIKILDYAYQTALYYVFLVASFGALALELCKGYKRRSLLVALASLSIIAWCYFIFGNSFILYNYGFQTQIFAYSLLALIAIASIYFNDPRKAHHLLILGVLSAGLSNTWFFLLPVAIIYLVLVFGKKLLALTKSPLFYVVFALCAAIALIPVLASHSSSGNSGSINLNGAVYPLTANNLIICALILVAAFMVPVYKQKTEIKTLWLLTLSSLIFSLLIAAYQWISIGELRYYFHKSIYIFPLLSAVALFVIIVHALNGLTYGKSIRPRALLFLPAVIIAVSLSVFTGMPRISRLYLYEHSMLLNDVDTRVIEEAFKAKKNHDVLSYETCNPGKAYINQRWVGSLLLNETDERYSFYSDTLLKKETPEKTLKYTANRPSLVLYNPKCASSAEIDKLKIDKNITLKTIDF